MGLKCLAEFREGIPKKAGTQVKFSSTFILGAYQLNGDGDGRVLKKQKIIT